MKQFFTAIWLKGDAISYPLKGPRMSPITHHMRMPSLIEDLDII